MKRLLLFSLLATSPLIALSGTLEQQNASTQTPPTAPKKKAKKGHKVKQAFERKQINGKYVALNLKEASWSKTTDPQKILRYLDEAYVHMQVLTSNTPFKGKISVIQENPPHRAYAFSGNPVSLNTKYVPHAVETMDADCICTGWVHEMGHNFDGGIGSWYMSGHSAIEFQANLKLAYVRYKMCYPGKKDFIQAQSPLTEEERQSLQATHSQSKNKGYQEALNRQVTLLNKEGKFSTKSYMAVYTKVVEMTSWDTIKDFYTTYQKMKAAGIARPSKEDRNLLAFAVLDQCAKMDLTPLYKEWGIALDRAAIDALLSKYQLKTPPNTAS